MRRREQLRIHFVLILFLSLAITPFVFVVNNSFRSNQEIYHAFFGVPEVFGRIVQLMVSGEQRGPQHAEGTAAQQPPRAKALSGALADLTRGYRYCWTYLKPYMLNSFFVSLSTALIVILAGSITAYVLSRYQFPLCRALFVIILSFMMIPPILTLVPSFLLVKKLGLLNSYGALILPYAAGGQVFAIYVFKTFFDGLPEDLFESARIDGAGHLRVYTHIVLPISKPIVAVVAIVNILGTWNNFLWPFICNSDAKYHVVASGLYIMSQTPVASNFSVMFAAYILSSLPILVLLTYGTKPFLQGITSGALKA